MELPQIFLAFSINKKNSNTSNITLHKHVRKNLGLNSYKKTAPLHNCLSKMNTLKVFLLYFVVHMQPYNNGTINNIFFNHFLSVNLENKQK